MQQELEIVTACNLLHHFHQHQVVVVRQVGLLKYRRALKLVGRHLVVPRSHWNAQLVRLQFELLHKCRRSGRYGSEVVVVQLLTFCRSSAKQCAACHLQIGTSGIQRLVNQKVFLLPSQSGNDLGDVFIKVLITLTIIIMPCRYKISSMCSYKRILRINKTMFLFYFFSIFFCVVLRFVTDMVCILVIN